MYITWAAITMALTSLMQETSTNLHPCASYRNPLNLVSSLSSLLLVLGADKYVGSSSEKRKWQRFSTCWTLLLIVSRDTMVYTIEFIEGFHLMHPASSSSLEGDFLEINDLASGTSFKCFSPSRTITLLNRDMSHFLVWLAKTWQRTH